MNYDRIIGAVRACARGEEPAEDISRLLYGHGCFYLLSRIKPGGEYGKKLERQLAVGGIEAAVRYKACADVFDRLKNIPYAVIKGAVLSGAAYSGPAYRKSGDIDLLINRKDADQIKKLLLDLGFVQGRQDKNRIVPYGRKELVFHSSLTHQLAPFIRQTGNPLCPYVNIDVNTDIIWGENGSKTDMDYVLLQTEPSSLNGTAFMKLRREMEFISLCLHHYKDMNSIYLLYGRGLKLSLFSDIYFYLQNAKPDAAELIRCAERLSVSQYVRYCLYFTGLVFGDEITGSYDRYFPGSINEDMLRSYGLDRREIRRWTMPFFDRLLSPDFRREFEKTLSEDDRRKIALNEAVME